MSSGTSSSGSNKSPKGRRSPLSAEVERNDKRTNKKKSGSAFVLQEQNGLIKRTLWMDDNKYVRVALVLRAE